MATSRAPKGGIVSQVNGQRYEGGEFTPDHGLYCGKGKNRVEKARVDAVNANLEDRRVGYDEKREIFYAERLVTFANGLKDWQRYFTAASLKTIEKVV